MKLIIAFLFIFSFTTTKKEYHKGYYKNGTIKEKGWMLNDNKIDYWYFYHPNGSIQAEGHFENGKKSNWWIFYNKKREIIHKCQLENGIKNGYCLKYKDNKLNSAEKYHQGKKINEWFSFYSFKKDNDLSDLK